MKFPIPPIMIMGITILSIACDNDDEQAIRPSVANFALETLSFSENDGTQELAIELDKPASEAGSLVVRVTTDALEKFEFSPALESGAMILEVPKGSSRVSFQVHAVDNPIVDGIKVVGFTIQQASRGLQVGQKNRLESTWVDNESPSRVGFALQRSTLLESAPVGSIVTLTLSHPAPGDGDLRITFSNSDAAYGTDFTTHPAANNDELILPVLAGATQVNFVVDPLNDALFNANRSVTFKIESVSSVLHKGQQISHELTLNDDELAGRPKSFATGSGNGWSNKKELHYAPDGKVERVSWETAMPTPTTGERLYFYNAAGLIEKVVVSPVTHILYVRENGRIVKAEEYDNNELDRYTLYGYDDMGNIGEVATYDRQSDGTFVFSLDFVFLYYNDGNLYKKLAYQPIAGGEPVLLSTDTYANYIDSPNPFPIEIIYGQPIQSKLPGTYIHETGEETYEYSFSYQFLPGGLPASRTATGPATSETTAYTYY